MAGPRPKLVCRDREVERLVDALAKASGGHGGVFLIVGETGIGKTMLVQEVMNVASSTGFKVLSAGCVHGSNTPYLPFQDALSSGDMEYLFAEASPRVEAAYLVTKTGVPVKDVPRQKTALNPGILALMLSAVGNFVKEAMSLMAGQKTEDFLNGLGYGDYRILIEGSPEVNLVVILTGRENEFLIEDMRETLRRIRSTYGKLLAEWDGDVKRIEGIGDMIEPLVFSGKFDGAHAGLDDPRARRNLLFENVSLGLSRHAQGQPILLCIDDLQWADPSSLALLQYVAMAAHQNRLLIIGTYQPEDVTGGGSGAALAETVKLMSREDRVDKMELRRLPREMTHDLLFSMLGNVSFGEKFEDELHARTEGNPLYMTEIVRMMMDEGAIVLDNWIWQLSRKARETEIPSKIHDVVMRRLNRLDLEERRILDVASVIGFTFSSSLLARALPLERGVLLERLAEIERTHRLVRPIGEKWQFDQNMIREVLYGEIRTERKKEYHSLVAESIESINKDDLQNVVGSLAQHYYSSSKRERAAPYLVMAAERARNSFSSKEATALYRQAIELEERTERKLELLERVGDIDDTTGDFGLSLVAYNEALALAQDPLKKGTLKAKVGKILGRRGEYSESLKVSSEALVLVQATGTEAEALALNNIGVALWGRGDQEKATEIFRQVLGIRTTLGDQRGMANADLNIGLMKIDGGQFNDAIEHLVASRTGFEKLGDLSNLALVFNSLGHACMFQGEFSKSLHWYAKAMRVREKIGDQRGLAYTMGNIGTISLSRGDHEKALIYYQDAMRIGERIGDQRIVAYSLCSIGLLHCERGEMGLALEREEKGLSMSANTGDPVVFALALHNLGVIQTAMGDYKKAIESLERSRASREKAGNKAGVAETCSRMAEAHFRAGECSKAAEFAEIGLKISSEVGAKEFKAFSQMMLGMIHRERKNWKESISNFEDSLRYYEEMGMTIQLGTAQCEYGLMWMEKGDVRKAEEHFKNAIESLKHLRLNKARNAAETALAMLERRSAAN